MKKTTSLLVLFILMLHVSCCTKAPEESGKTLCRINDFHLTLDEFEQQLTAEQELDPAFKLTREAKMAFLEELIRKELLIQEARKQKLDHREKFVRTIERYWEMTLIRDLLEMKGDELDKKAYVDQEAVAERYNEMKKEMPTLPALSKIEKEIQKELQAQKKSRMLVEWISSLRENAAVDIDKTLL